MNFISDTIISTVQQKGRHIPESCPECPGSGGEDRNRGSVQRLSGLLAIGSSGPAFCPPQMLPLTTLPGAAQGLPALELVFPVPQPAAPALSALPVAPPQSWPAGRPQGPVQEATLQAAQRGASPQGSRRWVARAPWGPYRPQAVGGESQVHPRTAQEPGPESPPEVFSSAFASQLRVSPPTPRAEQPAMLLSQRFRKGRLL